MTQTEYARMLIRDPEINLFQDNEIQDVITEATNRKAKQLKRSDLDGYKWSVGERYFTNPEVYYRVGGTLIEDTTAVVDAEKGTVTTSEPRTDVYMVADWVDWDYVHGKLLELIATDIQKFNTYSAGGVSEQFDKQSLLKEAWRLMGVRGADL